MGAVNLSQAVIPDMLKAGYRFISLTGAIAALRARAGLAPLAIAKASLRMVGQSLARESHPKGIHVVHLIVDGQIDTPTLHAQQPNRAVRQRSHPRALPKSSCSLLNKRPMLGHTKLTCGLTSSPFECFLL